MHLSSGTADLGSRQVRPITVCDKTSRTGMNAIEAGLGECGTHILFYIGSKSFLFAQTQKTGRNFHPVQIARKRSCPSA